MSKSVQNEHAAMNTFPVLCLIFSVSNQSESNTGGVWVGVEIALWTWIFTCPQCDISEVLPTKCGVRGVNNIIA